MNHLSTILSPSFSQHSRPTWQKAFLSIFLLFIFTKANAQQWEWAVSADSVYGDQETKMICKNNNDLYVLIHQSGASVINGTHLDSGHVIVKINTSGQVQWAKHYTGIFRSIYAANNGSLYFIGVFSGTVNFMNNTLISHGGVDVFYGEMDGNGNLIWVNTAGGMDNDAGTALITDSQGNLFITGHIGSNYFVGNQSFTGNAGMNTYLIRCDLYGNYLSSYRDSSGTTSYGFSFQKAMNGTLYLENKNYITPCSYICGGTNIIRIDPVNYSLAIVAQFNAYSYEYLFSWTINANNNVSADFNTCSHYMHCYGFYEITSNNVRVYRKSLGNGYDGKITPYLGRGIFNEIISGGTFDRCVSYANHDTLWYDSFIVLPDTLPGIVIGGIGMNNLYSWVLYSQGTGASGMSGMITDVQGGCYITGQYNKQGYYLQDTSPDPIAFGNTLLPAENLFTRFFVAGASTGLGTHAEQVEENVHDISIYPNPSSGIFTLDASERISGIEIRNILGEKIYSSEVNSENTYIDISDRPKGVYFLRFTNGENACTKKVVIH